MQINLLPYREEIKAERQKLAVTVLTFAALLAAVLIFVLDNTYSSQLDNLAARSRILNNGIAGLDQKIKGIGQLKIDIESTIRHKSIVEKLQSSRNRLIHFLNELAQIIPPDVYIEEIDFDANSLVTIRGHASSNSVVSQLMLAAESSQWFEVPTLEETRAEEIFGFQRHIFTVLVKMKESTF